MKTSEVSRRYARALYETAKQKGISQRIFDEVRELGTALEKHPELAQFLFSPIVSGDDKMKALRTALSKASEELVAFLTLLANKDRLSIFSQVAAAFEEISDRDHGVTRGVVKSARPVSVEALKRLEENVTKVTGKKVVLTFQEDPKVIAGLTAQVGGWTFDDSIESHLTRLSEDLNRRTH
ncbi:MAG: ATP synthase F1 subunit delta [Proteobacteria bacterium]|jgi:F-type H+-transporting ATPase subunit delta|nr:ATP synthase F1 subunit delta [Pseudomonadota bacterium]